jgi:uncharacterized repeat protein (TIGR01451 family)
MSSNELFSDESGTPTPQRASTASQRPSGRNLGVKGVGRLIFGLILLIGTFAGITVEAVIAASPASATTITQCTAPATGGTAQTFVEGTAATYSVACEGESGVSGTTAYPSSITIASGALPVSGDLTLASGAGCAQSTSGSGTTEQYILTCKITGTPTAADAGTYPLTFSATASPNGGSNATSGTLTLTVAAPTVTCIDPASGGTAATWHEGVTSSYTVECEEVSDISGVTAYPSSMAVASDTLPGDSNVKFATSTSSTPACTTGTSGSGTTEDYILECPFSGTPSASDAGTYAATFTATGAGGVGTTTSGPLNITVNAPTVTCIDPASGGTAATWHEALTSSYTVECEEVSGISGVTAYPSSMAVASDTLPGDSNPTFATSTSSSPACTTGTSGSGTTEDYILECAFSGTPSASDAGTYAATFTATGAGGVGTTTSGPLNITVNAATVTCIDPASGGTAATWHEGVTSSYTVECEEQSGISGVTAYPSSMAVASDTLPGDSNPTFATSTSSSPACTTGTSGSGTTEEYILECPLSGTPSASDAGTYAATFTATGAGGAGTATSGALNITVNAPTVSCIDPASGGSASTFFEHAANSYTVECEEASGISGVSAYPSSIAIASGALPADGNPTFATTTSSNPACTTGTSGTGTTEEYILECALADTPTSADAGSYPLTFTATGTGGVGTTTSGTLTVTVAPPTTTCTAPAAAGTSTSWVDGTAESYSVACYSSGFASASPGNYPASITLNSGTLPSAATEATSTTSSPACTQSTSGSGTTEDYILTCPVAENPTSSQNGTYHTTFLATGGANGAPNATSGTWTLTVSQPAPSWATSGSTDGNYFSAIQGVPFCYDIEVSAGQVGPTGTNPGSLGSLPLTSLTAGTTPSGVSNYSIQNVNLTAGTAQLCGTNNNTVAKAPVIMAPVATNSGGSATDSIPLWSQNECTWTSSGATVSMFDTNQDLEQSGSQSAFGQPITNGVTAGTTKNQPTCTGGVGVSASGGLGDAWTMNTANPLPTPTDSNPSAALGDLPSANLDLTSASSGSLGGCWGATNILASTSTSTFGGTSTSQMTLPSTWVNGGDCAYGSLGSNSAGGNTDTETLLNNGSSPATGDANCPPTQADVNAGMTNCAVIVSSGNDENGSTNYSSLDLFYNGQPVPQTPTATLSAAAAQPGDTVSVTGGSNWWGDDDGAPNAGPYGDFQNSAGDFYPVSAPQVLIGTSRATAVPVVNSTVAISGVSYACTGAESTSVGPNPCTLTVGSPSGSFQLPAGLAPGQYNVYIDESNTTPLPGNGPNDSYQTARGTSLGTVEAAAPINVEGVMVVKSSTTSHSDNGYGAVGDTITYTYAVTNTGPDPVTGIQVNDNLIPSADISCPSTTLAGGASENCTATYTVTQADVDNGSVTNTATTTATSVSNETLTSAPSSVTVYASDATSSLSLTKSVSPSTPAYGAAGDVIDYNFLVTNTGTTTESNIAINDALVSNAVCPDSSLAPGAFETCTGSYTVAQADVDAGSVTNTATASGTNPQDMTETSNSSTVTVPGSNYVSSLSLVKSTSSGGYASAGDTVGYSYDVTNTGTTTLSGIAVSDNLIAGVSCPDASLAPGASEICTGTYTVTAADITNGSVTNTATASATDPFAAAISSNSSSVTVDRTLFGIEKSTTSSGYGAAGDTIPYTYVLTNGTPGTLSNIVVTDSLIPSVSCPSSSLASEASETCTGTYTVTQADVDNGSVTNTASASSTDSQSNVVDTGSSSVTVLASFATSSLSLVKSTSSTGYGAAGNVIHYSYLVTNTGTTTENDVAVSDNLVASVSCPDATLAPGASETCTGSYTVTQADVDAGSVTNTASASATTPDPHTVTSNTSSVTVLASKATSTLSLVKSTSAHDYTTAGQVLNYSYKVTNTGTTTENDVAVSDNLISDVTCPDASLAPGQSETCTGSYTVTQTDVDNGSISNTATANATSPPSANPVASAPSSVTLDYFGITITTPSPLPTLTLGTPYSKQLEYSGGPNGHKIKWKADAGLPKGLKLSAAGLLHGTVLAKNVVPGTYTLSIQVTDGPGLKAVKNFSLTIAS